MILWFVAPPGFLIICSVLGIVNVISLVLPATACLRILGSVESVIIARWAQWILDCIMWNHSIIMHTWRYQNKSFWNSGLFSQSAEVSRYLEYQCYIKGTVQYFWCSLRCIKIWVAIYYRGLRFPKRAVVLLLLESDAACTGLNGHSAWKSAGLFLEWCYESRGDREQDLWRYWLPEGCITMWHDKPTGYGCLSKKCWLGEQ